MSTFNRARRWGRIALTALAVTGLVSFLPAAASAATPGVGDVSDAMRYDVAGPFGTPLADLSGEDDDVQTVLAPFPINFFGNVSAGLCVTTNGGFYPVPTDLDGCSNQYDADLANLALASQAPMIAALAADLDLGNCDDNTFDGFGIPCEIYFGSTTIGGRDAVVITWYRVPMYTDDNDPALSNTFQIVLIKAATGSDLAGWDFDIELNFGTLADGEDGYSALDPTDECNGPEGDPDCRWGIGWANYLAGPPETADPSELFAASPVADLLDSGTTPMVGNSLNSTVLGRYTWGMAGGATTGFSVPTLAVPAPPAPAPAPASPGLAATGTANGPGVILTFALLVSGSVLLLISRRGPRGRHLATRTER
jgi:hypothetical protein